MERHMSPNRKKTGKIRISGGEKKLVRARLLKSSRLTANDRKKIAKLSARQASALVSAARTLGPGRKGVGFIIL